MKYLLLVLATGLALNLQAQFIVNTGIEINNSAFVITDGEWTNDAPTRILNNGVIFTHSNFINNGVLDAASTGGFTLRSSVDHTFQPGGSRFGYFTKEQSGTLTVVGSFSILDSLRIKDGIVRIQNPVDTIGVLGTLTDSAFYIEDGSWIEGGLIARGGTGNLLFPFGKDGLYLPVTLHKVDAEKITVSLEDAPATHTAGPGVEALISFPYAWRVSGKTSADTSAYVEINYPNTLPVVTNPIVVREIPGQEYASMGARLIDDDGARTTVRSYSRRLNGLFSVAQGFPADPVTDSLALVSLYQSTDGDNWTTNTNWLSDRVETWFGVTVTGQSITAVELPNNNLSGPVANPLVDILSLQTINLSNNHVTAIPVFTENPEITSLNVSNNALDFASLEPNAAIAGINYLIQADFGREVRDSAAVGSTYTIDLSAGGANSVYTWTRNGAVIPDATSAHYTVTPLDRQTMGEFSVEATNSLLPGLVLKSNPYTVLAYANVSGRLVTGADIPASAGEITLYRVQPGAFEPVATLSLAEGGTWSFEKVVLDDYQIRGFADTLVHEGALPTYYENTIFWEEADTLFLTGHVEGLDITSTFKPGPASGRGDISGFFNEEVDDAGRQEEIKRLRPIARAGVSVRRVRRTGRTQEETLELVAYVFTNEAGEFTIPNLPEGEYRINFQYPGYPMDETTYTTIVIGPALESQVMVEATVLDGSIKVNKLNITAVHEDAHYNAAVFPNPAADQIHLKFSGTVEGRYIKVSGLTGQTLHVLPASAKEMAVVVRNWPAGVYILSIHENGLNVKTLRVAIEN